MPPRSDLYELARSLVLKSPDPIPRVVNPDPVAYVEGRRDTFWLVDLTGMIMYSQEYELRLVSPRAYWYVESGTRVSQSDIAEAARAFEEEIYPRVTAATGQEPTPGIDNDVHITILNGNLRGVAGYFSAADQHPKIVHPYSNERDMLYMNARYLRMGSRDYLATLAHELLHLAHWNASEGDEAWVSEGLAELAPDIVGYSSNSSSITLASPTLSLVHWPMDPFASIPYYDQSSMFFRYLDGQYGLSDQLRLKLLLSQEADGTAGIDAFLSQVSADRGFQQVFADWLVASLLDEEGGRYSYPRLETRVTSSSRVDTPGEWKGALDQYGAEYVAITEPQDAVTISFQGAAETALLPAEVGPQGCWWSNRGDDISSTLTREVDLIGVSAATLQYQVWYNVEEGWDYAYVQVSRDGGVTWDPLEAPRTTLSNPVGNSFGPGYTGDSDGWVREIVDLSAYQGQKVLLRFHYVTDTAVNGSGLCFTDIAIPAIGYSDADSDFQGWEARGFVLTDNRVPQDFIVQVIEMGPENRVTTMTLDETNKGLVTIEARSDRKKVTVIVAAVAPLTLQGATYSLKAEAPVPG